MSLNSFRFIVYFIAFTVMMLVIQIIKKIRKKETEKKSQLVLLLLFSYFFIYNYDWRFCICVFIVTVITFFCGFWIEGTKSKKILAVGAFFLIVMLGYFKYTNFFLDSFSRVFGKDEVTLNIILPVGISFYTFSALAYLIDVYRGLYKAEKNFLYVALYISFFPKLTAGPIARGKDFFPQIRSYRGLKWDAFHDGIQIFVFGLFKKIVLADRLGVFVDDVFFAPIAYNTGTVIFAAVSYSLQIYFDFSGYSDMAIGIAKIWGFDFSPNFNLPYLAKNASDFWKRWHISLSSWFQDYLYIPLGGNRKGEVRTYVNLIVVMLISGLWHGAGWTFVIWGLFHGLFSCVNRMVNKYASAKERKLDVLQIILTFIVVTLLWVVFRADSVENATMMLKSMFTMHTGISQPYTWSFFALAILIIGSVVAYAKKRKAGEEKINGFYPILDLTKFSGQVVFFTFVGLTIIMGYFGNTAFIYGNF